MYLVSCYDTGILVLCDLYPLALGSRSMAISRVSSDNTGDVMSHSAEVAEHECGVEVVVSSGYTCSEVLRTDYTDSTDDKLTDLVARSDSVLFCYISIHPTFLAGLFNTVVFRLLLDYPRDRTSEHQHPLRLRLSI